MKNKKLIIIISIVVVLIVGITSSLLILNNNKNKEELQQQEEINDRYTKISEKINGIINDRIKPIEEVINKDIGDDKTKIDELNNKKAELSKYIIIINDKKITDLKELKEENKKIANSLNKIDENLLNLKEEEIENYTISDEHQLNVLSKEITKLIVEINTLATKQAEKNAKEELKQKILSGDLSPFAGTYKLANMTLTIKNNKIIITGSGVDKIYETSEMKITQNKNGSYKLVYAPDPDPDYEGRFTITKNGKSVEQCELLGCGDFSKVN